MLEPAIGQRIASAADALRALDGAALVTPFAFGLAGRPTGVRTTAIAWALLALVGLVGFFQVVFPML